MENDEKQMKRIGFWINEKKCKKFDVPEFIDECRKLNMEVVKLDLHAPLQDQGPFHLILHKMTAVYAQALDGIDQARELAERFEQYLLRVPHVPVVDPVQGVHTLLNRPDTYALLRMLTAHDDQVMTPPYVELPDTDIQTKKEKLAKAGVTFPIVCKPLFGGGGTAAHELAVVLSGRRLADWRGPCVAQSFVQHGAVLYKLYVLGNTWHLVVRPSLKNFRATDAPTVHFNSSKVSKADSCSPLTQLDQSDREIQHPEPDHSVFDRIVRTVRSSINMDLLGIDVVIDSSTGQYAIIDVNPFPSYDSINDLMPCLARLLHDKIAGTADGSSSTVGDLRLHSSSVENTHNETNLRQGEMEEVNDGDVESNGVANVTGRRKNGDERGTNDVIKEGEQLEKNGTKDTVRCATYEHFCSVEQMKQNGKENCIVRNGKDNSSHDSFSNSNSRDVCAKGTKAMNGQPISNSNNIHKETANGVPSTVEQHPNGPSDQCKGRLDSNRQPCPAAASPGEAVAVSAPVGSSLYMAPTVAVNGSAVLPPR